MSAGNRFFAAEARRYSKSKEPIFVIHEFPSRDHRDRFVAKWPDEKKDKYGTLVQRLVMSAAEAKKTIKQGELSPVRHSYMDVGERDA